MVRWLLWFFPVGIILSQDDCLPPNFVYLEPIVDFFAYDPIPLDIIVTDRNEIDRVSLFYRFNNEIEFIQIARLGRRVSAGSSSFCIHFRRILSSIKEGCSTCLEEGKGGF